MGFPKHIHVWKKTPKGRHTVCRKTVFSRLENSWLPKVWLLHELGHRFVLLHSLCPFHAHLSAVDPVGEDVMLPPVLQCILRDLNHKISVSMKSVCSTLECYICSAFVHKPLVCIQRWKPSPGVVGVEASKRERRDEAEGMGLGISTCETEEIQWFGLNQATDLHSSSTQVGHDMCHAWLPQPAVDADQSCSGSIFLWWTWLKYAELT